MHLLAATLTLGRLIELYSTWGCGPCGFRAKTCTVSRALGACVSTWWLPYQIPIKNRLFSSNIRVWNQLPISSSPFQLIQRIMKILIICAVFALTSALPWYSNNYNNQRVAEKEGHFDLAGNYHARAMSYNNNPYRVASSQQQQSPGLDICKSATHTNGGLSTYVHVCQAGTDSTGECMQDTLHAPLHTV